ncbi:MULTISPECIES: recombinase RecT [unclassified Rhizobium]|uniref:recombinase RecT n=1 Tax=unclassified Rhizobium TaxID=2613769 RepID=UPI00288A3298|nr:MULTISPECIES: recombinase RecT [unclassified Rhizobium]
MNAVAKTEAAPRTSLIATMAAKYQMDADQFAKTVRATVMPAQHTNEQFAALMLVANEYDLNPVVKEIYAFPAKGGGIVPIVAIDGWVNLVNSHPACDGFEFEFEHDDQKKLVSCTCRMYRKDRGRPVTVTEYLSECKRSTDPWKMEHRMLRHKAMIQAARYAFGFSGIYDEDEGSKIAEMRDVTPPKPPTPPEPPSDEVTEEGSGIIDLKADNVDQPSDEDLNVDDFVEMIKGELGTAQSAEDLEEIWTARDPMAVLEGDDVRQGLAVALKNKNLKRLGVSL